MHRVKTAFVIRLGAIGDVVLVTPVLAALKRDGYHVTMLAKPHARWLLKGSGLVDAWVMADDAFEAEVTRRAGGEEGRHVEAAFAYSRELGAGHDRIVDLAGVIEGKAMVKVWEFSPEFARQSGVEKYAGHGIAADFKPPATNHVDMLLEAAGFDPAVIPDEQKRPVWRVSPDERAWARKKFKKWGIGRDNFTVVYQLSGSGISKTWPYYRELCLALGRAIRGVRIILLGIGDEGVLTCGWSERMPWVIPFAEGRCPSAAVTDESGKTVDYTYIRNPQTFRQDGALVEAADLYIGPDTSFLHVAGALGTPNVPLLTVTSHQHISKYYRDSYPVESPAPCSPCGLLVTDCHKGATGAAVCMEQIKLPMVMGKVLEAHEKWRDGRSTSRKSA